MTAFSVSLEIGDHQAVRWLTVDALVDTDSTYTWISRNILGELDITPEFVREFETADGRIVARDMAEAMVRLEGRMHHTMVVFADGADAVLLGVYTLEGFGLAVDPGQ